MELTLNTAAIDCYDKIFSQTVRKEETQDSVVPDTLPDIGEILCTSGNVLIRSKDVGEGRARIEANIPVRVAYATEEGDGVYCLEVNLPLYVSMEDEAIPDQCLCVADLKLAALETKVLNPRKVCVRAEAVFTVDCFAASRMEFSGAPEQAAEGVNVREREITVTPVCAVSEKTFVLTDEFTIPSAMPPAAAILSQDTQIQTEDVKSVGTKLVVKGAVRSSILYASEEMAVGALEFTTGFSQVIEAENLPEESYASVSVLLSGAYYDISGGDGRTGTMELHLVAQAVVCGKVETSVLADAYSNRCALETVTEPREVHHFRRPVTLRETLRAQIETPRPATELLQGRYEFGGMQAEGASVTLPVTVWVCYRTAEDAVCTVKRGFSVKFGCELEEGQSLVPVGATAQELYLSPSAGGVELRLPIELQAFVQETETMDCVAAIRCAEDAPLDLSDRPTLVILRAGSGDDLWTLARENASTVEAIVEANGLENLTAPWEKLLLIPKTI